MYVCVYLCTYICRYVRTVQTYIFIFIHTYVHVHNVDKCTHIMLLYTVRTNIYVRMYVCIRYTAYLISFSISKTHNHETGLC